MRELLELVKLDTSPRATPTNPSAPQRRWLGLRAGARTAGCCSTQPSPTRRGTAPQPQPGGSARSLKARGTSARILVTHDL
ncbi:hypothetical protein P4123_15795 [Pseudomonas aeruginosa]|nr:hypothetical protein [Pseudomonas aeruginosa]